MAKTLISADPGALMKVAKSKAAESIKALSERIRVDRKTLKAVNEGLPVKDSTLQTIATRLGVPISHLCKDQKSSAPTRNADGSSTIREMILQPLTAKLLRELIESGDIDTDSNCNPAIRWILNIDQITNDFDAKLLNFESLIKEWISLLHGWDHWGEGKSHRLQGQLAKIKMSTDVESHIQAFSAADLRLFVGHHLLWFCSWEEDPNLGAGLDYRAYPHGVIAIEPKKVTASKHRIDFGAEPPSFEEDPPPPEVNWIRVFGKLVYERSISSAELPNPTNGAVDE